MVFHDHSLLKRLVVVNFQASTDISLVINQQLDSPFAPSELNTAMTTELVVPLDKRGCSFVTGRKYVTQAGLEAGFHPYHHGNSACGLPCIHPILHPSEVPAHTCRSCEIQ
eukprot:TRINITY_DN12129_c1_g3_i3.p1 TRINITY_DN12129_c1_g3~~TRINITY_DN12129_c1_g3_i3.p1  ORF type:complete len:111 (+),score=7.63 TRINITY_DN12129_c1_g3_i3:718-1050(+)